jgi:hypothetical protein
LALDPALLAQALLEGLDGWGVWTGKEQHPNPRHLCEPLGVRRPWRQEAEDQRQGDEQFNRMVSHEHLFPSASGLWKDTKTVLWRAERSTTYQLQPRPSDVLCVHISKSDDLDNTCAKIGRRVTQEDPNLARLHIVAQSMLSSEANEAEAHTSSSLASFDHALRPDDTALCAR